jgi:acyl-ACP thioesterase
MANISKNTWSESYKINSPLVNSLGRLGLYGLLNLLQETAWIHAESLGFGMNSMEKQGLYWVLTRQNLQMKSWPGFGKTVRIETWLREPNQSFLSREFKVYSEDNVEIGACTTSWLALDRTTRQIIPAETLRAWPEITNPNSTGLVANKIPAEESYIQLAKFRVRISDLDINNHVNNTKYAQWILDSIPFELHKKFTLDGYSVNFLTETRLGDEVKIEGSDNFPEGFSKLLEQPGIAGESGYRGLRASDQKVLFSARLAWHSNLNASN